MNARKRKTVEEIEVKMTGGEPNFKEKEISQLDMVKALNWYTQNRDTKIAAKYISDYVKKNKLKVSAEIINKQSTTFGYLCRIKISGGILLTVHEEKFQQYLKNMIEEVAPAVKAEVAPTNIISIQDRVAEKIAEIAGDLEGAIDDYILGGFKSPASPYAILHGRAKAMHSAKIVEIFKRKRQQFDAALDGEEGYSNFNKTQLKKLVAYCDQIIVDANKISGEAKATQKPRKRKAKTPEQLVSKVLYCDEDPTYKLESVPPKQIIGAMQLWVFNIKTRKLGVYNADDASGFSVKGSALLNYSEDKSIQKTLRKPETVLPEVLRGGKVFLRNVIDNIKAAESKLNGRFNRDTVFLRIIK